MLYLLPRRLRRRVPAVSLLFALACAATLTAYLPRGAARARIGNFPKETAANYLMHTLEGREYTLAGLRGRVVVLNFFSAWCAHARDHVPTLKRFDDEDRERGLQIIGLALQDAESTSQRIDRFVRDLKIEYPVAPTTYAMFKQFVESNDLAGPQTLVYGRNGKLVAHYLGHSDEVDMQLTETVKRELEKKR